METPNPILHYLSMAQQEQTPIMANGSARVSRLSVFTEEPLSFEVELSIGPDQVRTYAVRQVTDQQAESGLYQVGPVQNGAAGPFSKLSESDLYYMIAGKALNDEAEDD